MQRFEFLSAVLFSMLTPAALAGDSAQLIGQSGQFRVRFYDPRVNTGELIFVDEKTDADDDYGEKGIPVPFSSECKASKMQIVCRRGGVTPLAGATYRLTLDGTPTCPGDRYEERFTCIQGCTPITPRYLKVARYEC